MERDPAWTQADADFFLDTLAIDDGPDVPFALDEPSGVLDFSGLTFGDLETVSDERDIIPIELDRAGLYTFLSLADLGTTVLEIFDDEGFRLLSTDAEVFEIEEPDTDTIYQFLPSYTGTHYLRLGYEDPALSGAYVVVGEVDFGEIEPDGNITPLATDDFVQVQSFEAVLLDPAANDYDEDVDGPPTGAPLILSSPQNGRLEVSDEGLIFRSAPGFTGIDAFNYETVDASGATDFAQVLIRVDPPAPLEGGLVSVPDAQRVAYLYEAALDRDGNIDPGGLNFWINAFASDFTLLEIAGFFTTNPEFLAAFGDPDDLTDDEYVELLYQNVLDRPSDDAGFAFWSGALDIFQGQNPDTARDQLLVSFAQSPENLVGSPEIAAITLGPDLDGDGDLDWIV